MKKILFFVLALFAVMGAFAQEKIAVFPFEDRGNVFTNDDAYFFYRQFSNEFSNKNMGRLDVLPRVDVDKLFNTEAAFQLTAFSAREKTAEMEKALNGRQILSGVIGKRGSSIRISISLYTYPQFVQLPGGIDEDVANTDELFKKIPELVQRMQAAIGGGGTRPPTNQTYKVGDTGPAGGIVFYDRGFIYDGWRYLEAAPARTEFTAEWRRTPTYSPPSGPIKRNQEWDVLMRQMAEIIGTEMTVGSGKKNTRLIVDHLRQLKESGRVAQICVGMNVNGYNDWFLPSLDELDLMYRNLKQKGFGGFNNTIYWSSSQIYGRKVWYQDFNSGSQGNAIENSPLFSVRAIRSF